ncbi:hypothetical protein ES703_71105 [subsurface metagenome]
MKTIDKDIYEKIRDDLTEQLKQDIEEYGLDNFDFQIIDSAASQEELDRKQKEYIKKLNTIEPHGYNVPEE